MSPEERKSVLYPTKPAPTQQKAPDNQKAYTGLVESFYKTLMDNGYGPEEAFSMAQQQANEVFQIRQAGGLSVQDAAMAVLNASSKEEAKKVFLLVKKPDVPKVKALVAQMKEQAQKPKEGGGLLSRFLGRGQEPSQQQVPAQAPAQAPSQMIHGPTPPGLSRESGPFIQWFKDRMNDTEEDRKARMRDLYAR